MAATMFRTMLISMFITSTALADTWTVDDDGKADFDNIQDAVIAASDGDEIVVMPGTYTSTADEVVDMLGKAVWLHSSKDAQVTIIDGEDSLRGIVCDSGETSKTIIEGFTITNGYVAGINYGGGMHNDNSSPTITNCTFANNSAYYAGGGMYNRYSNPTLTNCTFTNNIADFGGGMCNINSSPTLTNTSLCGNTPDQIYGNWIDNGGNTIADYCPNQLGACCVGTSDGCIDNVLESTCLAASGTWLGSKTVCVDGECMSPSCEADIDGSGSVDVGDLLAVIDEWGQVDSPADISSDGIVDVSDLLIVIGNWGPCE